MLILAGLLAGLGLLFIGLKLMSVHLQQAMGRRVRTMLKAATRSSFSGFFCGAFAGAAAQSSNAVTLIAGNLVRGGVFTTRDAIPVVAGANVGTSALVFIASIDMRLAVLMLIALVGMTYQLRLDRRPNWRDWMGVTLGLALLFLGLDFIKSAPKGIDITQAADALSSGMTPLLGLAIGFVAAVITQDQGPAAGAGGFLLPDPRRQFRLGHRHPGVGRRPRGHRQAIVLRPHIGEGGRLRDRVRRLARRKSRRLGQRGAPLRSRRRRAHLVDLPAVPRASAERRPGHHRAARADGENLRGAQPGLGGGSGFAPALHPRRGHGRSVHRARSREPGDRPAGEPAAGPAARSRPEFCRRRQAAHGALARFEPHRHGDQPVRGAGDRAARGPGGPGPRAAPSGTARSRQIPPGHAARFLAGRGRVQGSAAARLQPVGSAAHHRAVARGCPQRHERGFRHPDRPDLRPQRPAGSHPPGARRLRAQFRGRGPQAAARHQYV
ncbi:MAG: hypothetical protein B7Y61_22865 [Rhizobiales bacterium 35-66-30]|nr:MAG: hypothetical protein B7Y61_22865 [Rhizobiales bacterium 35-66-30]